MTDATQSDNWERGVSLKQRDIIPLPDLCAI